MCCKLYFSIDKCLFGDFSRRLNLAAPTLLKFNTKLLFFSEQPRHFESVGGTAWINFDSAAAAAQGRHELRNAQNSVRFRSWSRHDPDPAGCHRRRPTPVQPLAADRAAAAGHQKKSRRLRQRRLKIKFRIFRFLFE